MEADNTIPKTEVNFSEKQQEIFEKIISFSWGSSAFDIKGTLNLMALTYIRSERIEGDTPETRSDIAFHLEILQRLIDDLHHCELKIPYLEDKKQFFNKEIIGFCSVWNAAETIYDVKNTLSDLTLEYIRSEEGAGESQEDRDSFSFHLHLLNSLVSVIYEMIFNAE
jgi:hypothetical protein